MDIRKIVTISLLTFVVAVVFILGASVFLQQNKQLAVSPQDSQQKGGFAMAQVSIHNSISDCWLVIDSKAYNVTNFIGMHKGGSEAIASFCGKDATNAFLNRSGKGPHPPQVVQILDSYYVGNLQ